uniref:Large ribosomal subunit protein uL22c n=2 Tax=Isoetes TaxID=13838 RepID=A0A2U8KIV0_9TRAC|nr:ribosomal protein L22 [Isoetes melanopoda subsp. silvatica]AYM34697.1 ribosomal protein L22 [Isoetes louisianensis]
MRTNSSDSEVRALAKHIRMSAHKARRVVNQIRGRSYEQALMILEFMPYRACYPILKLISSASTNASQILGLSKANLFVGEARVDEGASLKRFQPRAQGRAYPIHKPTCHITIVVKGKSV